MFSDSFVLSSRKGNSQPVDGKLSLPGREPTNKTVTMVQTDASSAARSHPVRDSEAGTVQNKPTKVVQIL